MVEHPQLEPDKSSCSLLALLPRNGYRIDRIAVAVLDGHDRNSPVDTHWSLEKLSVATALFPFGNTAVDPVKTALAVADRIDNLAVQDIRIQQQRIDDQEAEDDCEEDNRARDGTALKLQQHPCSIHRRLLYWHVLVFGPDEVLSCCQCRR